VHSNFKILKFFTNYSKDFLLRRICLTCFRFININDCSLRNALKFLKTESSYTPVRTHQTWTAPLTPLTIRRNQLLRFPPTGFYFPTACKNALSINGTNFPDYGSRIPSIRLTVGSWHYYVVNSFCLIWQFNEVSSFLFFCTLLFHMTYEWLRILYIFRFFFFLFLFYTLLLSLKLFSTLQF